MAQVPVSQKNASMMARAVTEALGSLVSPSICDQLIRRSLRAQGLTVVPESGTEIGDWLEGSLRDEVETAVGPDAADLMMMQLGPIAAYAAFSEPAAPPARRSVPPAPSPAVRRPGESRGLTARPAPANDQLVHSEHELPMVLVASKNLESLAALRRCLAGVATVCQVLDLVGLFDTLEERATHSLLLVDCHKPTVNISSLSVVGEGLTHGFPVLLWGANDKDWAQLERERTPAWNWVRCSSEGTIQDVGSLCSMLLG